MTSDWADEAVKQAFPSGQSFTEADIAKLLRKAKADGVRWVIDDANISPLRSAAVAYLRLEADNIERGEE